jgi:FHA domain
MPAPASQSQAAQPANPAATAGTPWGRLLFGDVQQIELSGERAVVGRYDHDIGGEEPEVDLSRVPASDTVSRVHAVLEHIDSSYTLTDLNSTNATRINGKRLEPDKAIPINDGDTLNFGKVVCTFHKV